MNHTGPLIFTVTDDDIGQPIEHVVARRIGLDAAAEVFFHGGVWLNKRRVDDATQPAPADGNVIVHTPPNGRYAEVTVGQGDILYEDKWLLVLNKRQGWYCGVVPWDLYGNALWALGRYLRERDGSEPYLHMAHQLDRDTSGVLLFSRRQEVNARVHDAFKNHTTQKTYLCLCVGAPEESFEVETGHGRGAGGLFRLYPLEDVGKTLPDGSRVKGAHTRFTTLQWLDGAALVQANPITGRTHQIRLHLAHLGHPLLGDIRYGGPTEFADYSLQGHMLHAAQLVLPHPVTRNQLMLDAPLPLYFDDLLHEIMH